MKEGFYFGMKVSLDTETGIVIQIENNSEWDLEPGIIRWDTKKEVDTEDWRGIYESFEELGGKEIDVKTEFRFIDDKGKLKLN